MNLSEYKSQTEGKPLGVLAVLGALALALYHISPVSDSYARIILEAILQPAGRSRDLLTQAAMAAPYAFSSRLAAHGIVGIHHWLGISANLGLAILQIGLWTLEACFMFRLIFLSTGNRLAAFLGTLFFGFDVPLLGVDAPYSMPGLDRSLGLTCLLWAVGNLVRRERWLALIGTAAAAYLHGNPAIYVWPFLFFEDWLDAWNDPAARSGAILRIFLGVILALPLIWSGGGEPYTEASVEYARVNLMLFASSIAGYWQSRGTVVFELEGVFLILLAGWKMRRMASSHLWGRAIFVSLLMISVGTLSYSLYVPGRWLLGIIVKTQPWVGLYLAELAGEIWLAAWLASLIEKNDWRWPLFLLLLLFSSYPDLILRGAAVIIGLALAVDNGPIATLGAVATATMPWLYKGDPYFWRSIASAIGSHGSLFSGPAFRERTSGIIVAMLLLGGWMYKIRRGMKRYAAASLAVVLIGGVAVLNMQGQPQPEDTEITKMASWVRDHTEPNDLLLMAPLNLVECTQFTRHSERTFFACDSFLYTGVMLLGRYSAPMGDRLKALGFDFAQVRVPEDVDREIARMDRALTPDAVRGLGKKYGLKYFLTRPGRWPENPLFQIGEYALYRINPRAEDQ